VRVVGWPGDPLAVGQRSGQAVLRHRLEEHLQPALVFELRVEQHPGDLGEQQHLVVGGHGD
jgi:hypothetical protein